MFELKSKFREFKNSEDVKNFIRLSITSAANHLIRLVTGVINARLLNPILYGINTVISVLLRYSNYCQFGAQNGLNRQIPIDLGNKQNMEIRKNSQTVFWFLFLISSIILIISILITFLNINIIKTIPSSYFLEVGILIISNLYYSFFTSYLISNQEFKILSNLRLKIDSILALMSVLIAYYFSLHGLILSVACSNFIFIYFSAKNSDFKLSGLYFSSLRLLKLIRIGFPIMLGSTVYLLFSTIDLIYLSPKLSLHDIGIYGFALTGVAAYRVYSTSLSDILSPKMGKLFGETNSKYELYKFLNNNLYNFLMLLAFILTIFYYVIPAIILCFLPKYIASISIFKQLLIGALVMSISIPSGIVFTILKKNWYYTSIVLSLSILTYLTFFILKSDNNLIQVPTILCFYSLIFSIAVIVLSVYFTENKINILFISKVLLLLVSLILVIVSIDLITFQSFVKVNYINTLLELIIKFLLANVIFLIIALFYNKNHVKL